jgi:hypothetical protein
LRFEGEVQGSAAIIRRNRESVQGDLYRSNADLLDSPT